MYFFLVVVILLLILDNYVHNNVKKYVNDKYKKSLRVLNKFNPLYKIEQKHSRDSFLIRMFVLALFWLCINLVLIVLEELKDMGLKEPQYINTIDIIEDYRYPIFIITGFFVYFFLNIYCKNNTYLRTADIILSIIPTAFVIFVS